MSTLSLRFPGSLRRGIKEFAKRVGVSIRGAAEALKVAREDAWFPEDSYPPGLLFPGSAARPWVTAVRPTQEIQPARESKGVSGEAVQKREKRGRRDQRRKT